MNNEIRLQITEDGTIRSIYKDGHSQELKELLGAKMIVERASHVEWEIIDAAQSGWTVRAFHDLELAIRIGYWEDKPYYIVSKTGELAVFETREVALKTEVDNFWKLLPSKEE